MSHLPDLNTFHILYPNYGTDEEKYLNYQIAVITDSTNDLPKEFIEKYGIRIVPLTIVWGDKQYLDGVEITPEEFYSRLGTIPQHPTTSQPAPRDFLAAYDQVRAEGASEILVITISGAMSGTIESARAAAENYPIPVHIVDSKSNSMSLGWEVLAAVRARETGAGIEEMKEAVEAVRNNLHFHIVLDTLEYLVKGGRIAGAARFVGNVLNIKPQIRVNHHSGSVEAGDVSRTRRNAIESLYKGFFKKLDLTKDLHIAVLHNAAQQEAEILAAKIKEDFNPKELIVTIVSPVLGTHTGPKAIALCGYSEP